MSAQSVYGEKHNMVIPVPEADGNIAYYESLYPGDFKMPKQLIHIQRKEYYCSCSLFVSGLCFSVVSLVSRQMFVFLLLSVPCVCAHTAVCVHAAVCLQCLCALSGVCLKPQCSPKCGVPVFYIYFLTKVGVIL